MPISPIEQALALLDIPGMYAFAQRLVQTPSVFLPDIPGANEEAAARLIYELLQSWGWQPLWEEVAPGRPNIIAELQGSLGDGALLLFEGHTDVVTPGDLGQWTHAPFGGEIVEGRLYGRGAADMKAGVAAMLFAARALQLTGAPFKGRIRLLIPVDEEGLMLGIKHMVAQGHANGAIAAIICEPEEREICLASKGALRLRIVSHGRIAHGAMPEEGINALSGMIRLLGKILELEQRLQSEYGSHPLLGKLYISPTVIRAPLSADPSQLNCLPDCCDVYLDIRSIPAIEHSQIIADIRGLMEQICAGWPSYRFDLEVIDDRPAVEIAENHPVVQALAQAHKHVYGEHALWGGVPGSTDGTIIARDAGVPVVVYGPGNKRIPHQPDEHVDLEEITKATQVYIRVVMDMLGSKEWERIRAEAAF